MKNSFEKAAALAQAEEALKSWGVEYKKQRDGSLVVPGILDISGAGLAALPDLSRVKVRGSFSCSGNQLASLAGAPQTVGGDFFCCNNRLASLEHAPRTVGGGFYCGDNLLASLEGAPRTVGGGFSCYNNQLTSLEHAPAGFRQLNSDFGVFATGNEVPEQLRLSPAAAARLERERLTAATVLQAPLAVSGPLRFKRPASPA